MARAGGLGVHRLERGPGARQACDTARRFAPGERAAAAFGQFAGGARTVSTGAGEVAAASVPVGAHVAGGRPATVAPRRAARARYFCVLAWAAGGMAATTVLAMVYAMLGDVRVGLIGTSGALNCVLIELGVLAGVATLASRLAPSSRSSAHVLLWGTALVHMVLINAFASALGAGDAELRAAFGGFVASTVFAAGAVVVLTGCLATAIGFEGRRSTPLRWGAALVLVGLPTALVAPGAWWTGVLAACLLAWSADGVLDAIGRHRDSPAPALGACVAAGIVALVLLGVFSASRIALQFVATAVETFGGA